MKIISRDQLLKNIADGLTGYMLYQTRCGMTPAFSEYLLYEPIVRIVMGTEWSIKSEVKVDTYNKIGKGDYKRIDFRLFKINPKGEVEILFIEVKYIKRTITNNSKINIDKDVLKLKSMRDYAKENHKISSYVIVAGRKRHRNKIILDFEVTDKNAIKIFSCGYLSTRKAFGADVFKIYAA